MFPSDMRSLRVCISPGLRREKASEIIKGAGINCVAANEEI